MIKPGIPRYRLHVTQCYCITCNERQIAVIKVYFIGVVERQYLICALLHSMHYGGREIIDVDGKVSSAAFGWRYADCCVLICVAHLHACRHARLLHLHVMLTWRRGYHNVLHFSKTW